MVYAQSGQRHNLFISPIQHNYLSTAGMRDSIELKPQVSYSMNLVLCNLATKG